MALVDATFGWIVSDKKGAPKGKWQLQLKYVRASGAYPDLGSGVPGFHKLPRTRKWSNEDAEVVCQRAERLLGGKITLLPTPLGFRIIRVTL